ncbi:MAG: 16S rRNA (cytidine(1402)-2'-O)-methyltransferase [Proteobacteria bacterium]|nr:MAG: 16S rRNA (cytidine(1402)-2'-O)-methyltransferase [Pseudomonadota bacterium]
MMQGTLYIVATPIGNLEDMTCRSLRVLKDADLIAAEDTRHTKRLLNHFGISTPLVSYYREKEAQRSHTLIAKMQKGAKIALVSDAGTPAISDPGAVLVRQARKQGITIVPIPGPSALSAALSCAGLEPGSFLFLGFPPAKPGQRKKLLKSLVSLPYPLVFYESPHRIGPFIDDAGSILGNRVVFWAREMTKAYEEIIETTVTDLARSIKSEKTRGELVVIIHPDRQTEPDSEDIDEILSWYRDKTDLSLRDACRKIARDLGVSRTEIYRRGLDLWKEK